MLVLLLCDIIGHSCNFVCVCVCVRQFIGWKQNLYENIALGVSYTCMVNDTYYVCGMIRSPLPFVLGS